MQVGNLKNFHAKGWVKLPKSVDIVQWVHAAKPFADAAVADSTNREWLRCQGTWFVGVNALANESDGSVGGVALPRSVRSALQGLGLPDHHFDRAQVSVMYPGYPKPREGESEAAFRYRRDRDAAHVDGLLPLPPNNRRFLREPHAFVLGLPLTETSSDASPLVVWEGSHAIIRDRLGAAFSGSTDWTQTDITKAYHAARRHCFEHCKRMVVAAKPGEAYLIHRLALHGVAPWVAGPNAPPEGRMIAYFRPELAGDIKTWITDD